MIFLLVGSYSCRKNHDHGTNVYVAGVEFNGESIYKCTLGDHFEIRKLIIIK